MTYLGMDTSDAIKIDDLFKKISEDDKNMALGYLSALADKAVVNEGKKLQKA